MAALTAVVEQPHRLFEVAEPEDAGAARRAVGRLAADGGVEPSLLPRLELVVTELATNLVRHAEGGGTILARTLAAPGGCGVEVLSVDAGPGIRDLHAALNGSAVAPGGLGCGLAAVRRMATTFDVYTGAEQGTAVLARLLPGDAPVAPRWAGVAVAFDGGADCGDAWAVIEDGGRLTALVVDGLGHGEAAALAARAAVDEFVAAADADLESLARRLHAAMNGTRGGAAALCRLDPGRRRAQFLGVGNVAGRLVGSVRSRALVSMSGTLGTELVSPRIHALDYDIEDGDMLMMSTDGVRDGFDMAPHRRLGDHDPALAAAVVHHRMRRGTDDATVLVVQPVHSAARVGA